MFRLVNFHRSFAKIRPIVQMYLIKNYSRTYCKASSVNNDVEETIKPHRSVLLKSPSSFDYEDFKAVHDWMKSSKYFNLETTTDPCAERCQSSEKWFIPLAKEAFNTLLYPFHSDTDLETVLLYYTGHGLSINKANEINGKPIFSSPSLDDVGISNEMLRPAAKYITPKRPVKGGEFDLGKLGYCDLGGILELWITVLTRSPAIKNKHLIVIADSCFSGMLVKDLQQLALKEGPWNQNGCSVTVQSACSQDKVAFVGDFIPCFINFNKPENHGELEDLKKEWNNKSEVDKKGYRNLNLPSPQVATTMPSDQLSSNLKDPTMKFLPDRNFFPLNFFDDPGFFKYCFLSFSEFEVMTAITFKKADQFLEQSEFKIVDFKLKTTTTHQTPLGLFLLKHPDDNCKNHLVRVCIHFSRGKPSSDHLTKASLTSFKVSKNRKVLGDVALENKEAPKLEVPIDSNVERLVKQCLEYSNIKIQEKDPVRWLDALNWSMTESYKRKKRSESMMKV